MHQKPSRGLKFRIKEVEELYCLSSENKDADQLRGDHEANLRLCYRICKKQVFSRAQLSINLLTNFYYTVVVLMHTNKVKQGNKCDVVSGIARKVLNIFKTIFEYIFINLLLMKLSLFQNNIGKSIVENVIEIKADK